MPVSTDYKISTADAKELLGAVLLPVEFRRTLLTMYAAEHGAGAIIELFAQFMGMANSVVENNREMAELILISEGGMWPHNAEQANLPTIFGALNGVVLANKVSQRRMCAGCAYRLGTCANQSPITTTDAQWVEGERDFMCHEHLSKKGEPTRKCRGAALATPARPDREVTP